MTATGVNIVTLDLSGKSTLDPSGSQVLPNVSYALNTPLVTTLWANNENGNTIDGLLYVPTIDPSLTDCSPSSLVPTNVTRLRNLPPGNGNYPYIGVAPWLGANCARAYLSAVQQGPSAMIFFLPDNGTVAPPPVTSPSWYVAPAGSWGGLNTLPIYALPGAMGQQLLYQMSLYSGSLSAAPNADFLAKQYSTSDYIRIYARFSTQGNSHYPTLWAFLLIVLGVVLVLVGVTSLSMRWKQRRSRNRLRQRILAGEVDMEILGIKKSPRMLQADVDALKTFTYNPTEKVPTPVLPAPSSVAPASAVESSSATTNNKTTTTTPYQYDQSNCAICLDDYVVDETRVRALPCHHIYHPECIDPHLLASTALCPVCKARVPTLAESEAIADPNCIQVPEITNAMVRRERYIRHRGRRERGYMTRSPAEILQGAFGGGANGGRPLFANVGVRRASRRQSRSGSAAEGPGVAPSSTSPENPTTRTEDTPETMELGSVHRHEQSSAAAAAIPLPPSPNISTASEHPQQQQPPLPPPPPPQQTTPPPASAQHHPEAPRRQHPRPSVAFLPAPPERPPASNPDARREWARRRASALLHRHSRQGSRVDVSSQTRDAEAALTAEEETRARRPAWRRGLDAVFPGFR